MTLDLKTFLKEADLCWKRFQIISQHCEILLVVFEKMRFQICTLHLTHTLHTNSVHIFYHNNVSWLCTVKCTVPCKCTLTHHIVQLSHQHFRAATTLTIKCLPAVTFLIFMVFCTYNLTHFSREKSKKKKNPTMWKEEVS